MRDSFHRAVSYKKKIRGLVLPLQKLSKNATVQREVEIERMVNSLVGFSLDRGHYMIFAKQVSKLMRRFKGDTLATEVCIKFEQWKSRGLDTTIMNNILTRMNMSTCYVAPSAIEHIETRYFRGDQQTVNGLLAYILGTTQSDMYRNYGVFGSGKRSVQVGIRVWKRAADGVETEITSGIQVALATRGRVGGGLSSGTWVCPEIALVSTDAIVVRVYIHLIGYSWELAATFITEQLGSFKLSNAIWTVYYFLSLIWAYDPEIGWMTSGGFSWGTPSYNSRIENFRWWF